MAICQPEQELGESRRLTANGELARENARLKSQLSLLSTLVHRVATSLDLDVVLQEVVDGACELAGARYGALALVDSAGGFQRLFSHGLSQQERDNLGELPQGKGMTGLLHDMRTPLRVSDISGHARFVGFPPGHPRMTTFLGANIEDEGGVQGILYLADKARDDQFSDADEELLMLFVQQAAAAIRNARRFEEAQQARAEAESAHLAIRESELRLREDAEELESVRTDLLAAIAHEFRTPLTAIRTAVGILQDPELAADDSQEQRLLQAIAESSVRMQGLVSDLVDLAKFQSGSAPIESVRLDGCAITREAVRAVSTLLESKRQTVTIEGPKRVWVYGDRARLERALINLLSNAVKFAPEGSLIAIRTGRRDGAVEWAVTDNGPGIPLPAQRYIFERFFTMARRNSPRASGTGLGLPIAMAIARAHGGTIDVESRPGEGSTFTLRVVANGSPAVERA